MKYHVIAKSVLTTILALVLCACSGSGSGPNPFDESADDGTDGPVSVTITSPAAGGTLETPDDTVSLAGTADSSSAAIVSVSWQSDKAGEGTASGSEAWETDAIPLQLGENTITITAEDSAGQTASRTVVIKREGDMAGTVTLSWTAPTLREDESALTGLAGYYIRYGRMSEIYDYEIKVENPGIVSYVVENLSPGTWYFVVSAYDGTGLVSDHSNEITMDVP
jgi:hypothetical protein